MKKAIACLLSKECFGLCAQLLLLSGATGQAVAACRLAKDYPKGQYRVQNRLELNLHKFVSPLAIELVRGYEPENVAKIEIEYGEFLEARKEWDEAITHFIEGTLYPT